MLRISPKLALCIAVVLLIVASITFSAHSQATEPTALIDAAYKDVSQKLGQTVGRQTLPGFTWSQEKFPDASLGCPMPGQTYAQVKTPGYRILIAVNVTVYDYRAKLDGTNFFFCSTITGVTAATLIATSISGSQMMATSQPAVPVVVSAQGQSYTNPIVYTHADGNIVVSMAGAATGTALTNDALRVAANTFPFYSAAHIYGQFRWSPDGMKLLYTDLKTSTLFEVISGNSPITLAAGIDATYPGAWSADGSQIAYVVGQANGTAQIQVIPTAGGQAKTVVTFTEQTGCGGGSPDPAEVLYQEEAGSQGNAKVLAFTPGGFLATTTCFGGQLTLFGSNGLATWQQMDIVRAVVAPDHTRAAGLSQKDKSLNIIDLTNGNLTPLTTQNGPVDQLAWSADGTSLFYSTLVLNAPVKGVDTSQVGKQLFSGWPLSAQSYTVTLWEQPLSGEPAVKLFSREGRGIGVIAPLSGNPDVLVSFVDSSAAMIQQINTSQNITTVIAAAPRSEVLLIPISPVGNATRLDFGGQPAAASKGVFVAVLAGSSSAPAVPTTARLVASITPAGVACTTPPANWVTYTVQVGDTLTSLAARTGSTIDALSAANCLTDPNTLQVGQALRVPSIPASVTPSPVMTATP